MLRLIFTPLSLAAHLKSQESRDEAGDGWTAEKTRFKGAWHTIINVLSQFLFIQK